MKECEKCQRARLAIPQSGYILFSFAGEMENPHSLCPCLFSLPPFPPTGPALTLALFLVPALTFFPLPFCLFVSLRSAFRAHPLKGPPHIIGLACFVACSLITIPKLSKKKKCPKHKEGRSSLPTSIGYFCRVLLVTSRALGKRTYIIQNIK